MKSLNLPGAYLVAMIVGIALATGSAGAVADGPDHFRVIGVAADDVLNIRSRPSARSRKIGRIPHDGNGLRNLGCSGGLSYDQWQRATPQQREAAARSRWCRIEFKGIEGWVAARFLGEGQAPDGRFSGLWEVHGVASDDTLNVRVAPSARSGRIGALSPFQSGIEKLGCEVPSGSSTAWCEIRIDGLQGWVAGRFLRRQ